MKSSTLGFNPEYGEDAPSPDEVSELPGSTLLEFGAPWCGHCRAATPAVESAMKDYPALRHIKVYDGKGKRLGRAFKVSLWPTLVLLHDGEEVARQVRPVEAEEVLQLLTQSL